MSPQEQPSQHRHLGGPPPLRKLHTLLVVVVSCCLIYSVFFQFQDLSLLAPPSRNDFAQLIMPAGEIGMIHSFEIQMNKLLREYHHEGLSPPNSSATDKIHYKVSKFQLALGHSTKFPFIIQSTNSSGVILDEAQMNSVDRLVCKSPVKHMPHFAQVAFPCWSTFQLFPNAERFLEVNMPRAKMGGWIGDLIQAYEEGGIQILDDAKKLKESNQYPAWEIHLEPVASGWIENDDKSYFEQGNPTYFLENAHVQSLQKIVLGNSYISSSNEVSLPLKVLIVTRKGHSRELIHANETATQLTLLLGQSIEVRVLPNPEGSLQNQALEFHNADIIISPHGAQLTNLAFIKPCTTVLELFPIQYYLAFFQPYVLSADGVAYEGYPFGRQPLYDSRPTRDAGAGPRAGLRAPPVKASPESILRAFPALVLDHLSCRKSITQAQSE